MTAHYGLIADIGGTNARFALAPRVSQTGRILSLSEGDVVAQKTLNGKDYPHIRDAIEAYLSSVADQYGRPEQGCLAIACPTDRDQIRMTNHTWQFSVRELQQALSFRQLRFINDYHALANSIPYLGAEGAVQVGRGESAPGMPMAVTGPGTGLGLAGLAFSESGPVTLQTEGGHAHFAPTDDIEVQVLSFLLRELPRVSWERLLSGMGLENLYRALGHIHGTPVRDLSAPDISAAALSGDDPLCAETLSRFCALLGSYAGDVALALGARGGVFIAGGIVPRFLDYFQASDFRDRFEDKARLREFNEPIPTRVIVSEQPGLLGAAAVLNYDWG
ncbi:MAG: glucokinase [Natronospirillum sp.]|uniref:glucokinase n=1 Tax=Natronospirillum sp. TaxID=2812955 RepID=UPI0026008889|nr:glucokinase [Natronospirillum sp.]MCH8552045.1 glucokinase [Natronospirillum sp.]